MHTYKSNTIAISPVFRLQVRVNDFPHMPGEPHPHLIFVRSSGLRIVFDWQPATKSAEPKHFLRKRVDREDDRKRRQGERSGALKFLRINE